MIYVHAVFLYIYIYEKGFPGSFFSWCFFRCDRFSASAVHSQCVLVDEKWTTLAFVGWCRGYGYGISNKKGVASQAFLVGGLEDELYDFPDIGKFIIPTDEVHHFSEGLRSTTNQIWSFLLVFFYGE